MEDVIRAIGMVLVSIVVVTLLTVWMVHERRRLTAVDAAWRAFAEARGFAFSPHRGWSWWHLGLGSPPCLRGVVDGVSVEVGICGIKEFNSTRVVAVIQVPFAAPAAGSPVLPERLEGEAALRWAGLASQRPDVRMVVWPGAAGQQTLVLGWELLEQEATVLDNAMALVAMLARRPLVSFGEP